MALRKTAAATFLCAPKKVLAKVSVARVFSKPPRQRIGAGQTFLVMSVFTVAMLAPAAWILHHLPEYRRKSLYKNAR
ncbi:COX8 domain-containing protein [Syngnathus typhle]|uniref:COX8 domain-containing protein n=1 Tax=Syngnathus typhle TaxID=161592 RepID=UPI002A6A99DD|nr:COX8 domain-containing protein [Syngnathus typhle]